MKIVVYLLVLIIILKWRKVHRYKVIVNLQGKVVIIHGMLLILKTCFNKEKILWIQHKTTINHLWVKLIKYKLVNKIIRKMIQFLLILYKRN
jgi:hypothetical protein